MSSLPAQLGHRGSTTHVRRRRRIWLCTSRSVGRQAGRQTLAIPFCMVSHSRGAQAQADEQSRQDRSTKKTTVTRRTRRKTFIFSKRSTTTTNNKHTHFQRLNDVTDDRCTVRTDGRMGWRVGGSGDGMGWDGTVHDGFLFL